MKTIKKRRAILFIAYIEVTFLHLQHKIHLMDISVIISFKTDNLLKTIGKLIFETFSDWNCQFLSYNNLLNVKN